MPPDLAALSICVVLVVVGAAIQVAVGAGLSVVCGSFVLLWLGSRTGVPLLLALNLLLSIVATMFGTAGVRWIDAALAGAATVIGCIAAAALPALPDPVLRAMTAAVLLLVALPRRAPRNEPTASGAPQFGIGLAGIVTGLLTVWTATPGPITAVAMARAGRSGSEIRRTMQPISVVGYGAGVLVGGVPTIAAAGLVTWAALIAATLAGTAAGFAWRSRLDPARVVLLIRTIATLAAILLIVSLFR